MRKKLIELSDELFKRIEDSAKKNERSVNKEIAFLLKKSLENKL